MPKESNYLTFFDKSLNPFSSLIFSPLIRLFMN